MAKKVEKPRLTAAGYEQALQMKAYEHAMQLYEEGKATPAITLHFLKSGSRKELLQLQKLEVEAELAAAKANEIREKKEVSASVNEVMDALRTYSGTKDD